MKRWLISAAVVAGIIVGAGPAAAAHPILLISPSTTPTAASLWKSTWSARQRPLTTVATIHSHLAGAKSDSDGQQGRP